MRKGIQITKQIDGTYMIHLFESKKRFRASNFKNMITAVTHYYSGEHDTNNCPICKRIYK